MPIKIANKAIQENIVAGIAPKIIVRLLRGPRDQHSLCGIWRSYTPRYGSIDDRERPVGVTQRRPIAVWSEGAGVHLSTNNAISQHRHR